MQTQLDTFTVCHIVLLFSASPFFWSCTHRTPAPIPPEHQDRIQNAIDIANFVIDSNEFEQILTKIDSSSFDHSSDDENELSGDSGLDTLSKLRELPSLELSNIRCKNTIFPSSKGNAWEGNGSPVLNRRKLGTREPIEWVETLIHERTHNVGYEHDGQYRSGNECTTPYMLGSISRIVASQIIRTEYIQSGCVCPNISNILNNFSVGYEIDYCDN